MLVDTFIKEIRTKERSKATMDLIKFTVVNAQNWINKPLEDAAYEDVLAYIEHIKKHGLKANGQGRVMSKSSMWTVENKLIHFYKFCFNETDDPKYHKMVKKLRNIRVDKPKNELSPKDILLPEEIKRLINVANLERDRCLIAVLYESGMRLGELLALNMDMVELDEIKQEVTFHIPNQEGCKTGARSVLCLEVFGYVQDWLKCNTDTHFMPLSESGIRKISRNLFKRAGINKPCNPHAYRHSSITNAAIMKMQPNQISMRYWGIANSSMLSVYLHLSEQIVNSGYRDAKGLGNGNGNTVINPLATRCVNCGRLIQSGNMCKPCQENIELKELLKEEQLKNDFILRTLKAKGII